MNQNVYRIAFTFLFVMAFQLHSTFGQKKVKLQLNLKKGDVFKTVESINQDIAQTIMGMDQNIQQNFGMDYAYEVLEVDPNKNYRIKVTYERVRYEQKGNPMGDVAYDSGNPSQELNDQVKSYAALVGQGFQLTVTPTGKIKEVRGADELLTNMVDSYDNLEETQKEQLKQTLSKQFGNEAIRENMAFVFDIYPEEKVSVGDEWSKTLSLTSALGLKLTNTWKLVALNGGVAEVQVKSVAENAGGSGMEVPGVGKMNYNLSGTQEGMLSLDQKSGWTKGAEVKQDFSGDVELEGAMSMTWPITIKSVRKMHMAD
ncbi:DUF6263 family protein [Rapidithrix thailandica]|uniref:DUF6263 family protein n=1 Tax=Rapidithrix thailandica TaxID=413964 RepID=A0AAW9RZJ3_9BACT